MMQEYDIDDEQVFSDNRFDEYLLIERERQQVLLDWLVPILQQHEKRLRSLIS